jgi:hypothetical protein
LNSTFNESHSQEKPDRARFISSPRSGGRESPYSNQAAEQDKLSLDTDPFGSKWLLQSIFAALNKLDHATALKNDETLNQLSNRLSQAIDMAILEKNLGASEARSHRHKIASSFGADTRLFHLFLLNKLTPEKLIEMSPQTLAHAAEVRTLFEDTVTEPAHGGGKQLLTPSQQPTDSPSVQNANSGRSQIDAAQKLTAAIQGVSDRPHDFPNNPDSQQAANTAGHHKKPGLASATSNGSTINSTIEAASSKHQFDQSNNTQMNPEASVIETPKQSTSEGISTMDGVMESSDVAKSLMFNAMNRQPVRSLRTPIAKPKKNERKKGHRRPQVEDDLKYLQRVAERRHARSQQEVPSSFQPPPARLPGWALSEIDEANS